MMKKIDDENQKAKLNATTNKRGKSAILYASEEGASEGGEEGREVEARSLRLASEERRNKKSSLFSGTSRSSIAALAALRNKKTYEGQLDRLTGTRMTLETQVSSPPSSSFPLSSSPSFPNSPFSLVFFVAR